jgi:pimeloyl-ACP methyl ester carboxylesterase
VLQPREHYSDINGANLCWFEWGEPTNEATIVLIHATGFHARCWDQVIKHLPGRHVIALDMRGHGRSSKHGPVPWDVYGEDAAAFIASLDFAPLILAGHSMGGYCVVSALGQLGDNLNKIQDVVLVDPVILNPESYAMENRHAAFLNGAEEHPVARRRNHFVDAAAMYDNLHGRGSYASWLDEALHDYCHYGLLPDPEQGGYKLACPPTIEASVYMGSQNSPIFDALAAVTVPVTVLRAAQRDPDETTMDFTKSPTWSELAAQFQHGRDVYLPELTHFMPMQDPQLVAAYIKGER